MNSKDQVVISKNVLLSIIALAALWWLVKTYQVLFGPLIIASLIAYLLYPGVTWLADRLPLTRRQIVPYVYALFLGFVVWAGVYLFPIILSQANTVSRLLAQLPNYVGEIESYLNTVLDFKLPLEEFVDELEANASQTFKPERVFRIIGSVSTNFVWVVVVFITSFHLLRDWERLREWLFGLVPDNLEPDFRRLHQEIKTVWRVYLRGQLLIMTILGVISGIGAAVVGVPGALLLGFLAGTLALIPSLGPALATIIAALVAWVQGSAYFEISNFTAAVIVVLIFQGIQLIEGFWLTPRIMGRRLNLHPGLVLIAVVGTLFTLGALIALVIVPLLGSVIVILRYIRARQAGRDPWPELTLEQSGGEGESGA